MRIVTCICFLFYLNINAQIQDEFFVDDVKTIDILTVNFCVDNLGKTSSVVVIPEKTTYENQQNIAKVVEYQKNIEYYPDSKLRNKCFDFIFKFINSKFENKKLEKSKFSKCKEFKNGTFKYNDGSYLDIIIERDDKFQIEKSPTDFSKYQIEWTDDTNYVLTYLELSNKKLEYLIGEKIYVEIIDILEDGSYVYKSNLLDRTLITGIIKRIN
ncbi:hypothetical protein [Flavobacterium fluviale]|uniref:Uncharacterized protein n=1 Tax=Flavobacterium fluviale TaxID=2249356 RepID=A0A344LPZ3_9FLAO|nr:hypothetical protein [Flavobacterium fluviale]AXB55985.1 hypothetical protein HYN86_04945 [Flavobacterium fluviale]